MVEASIGNESFSSSKARFRSNVVVTGGCRVTIIEDAS